MWFLSQLRLSYVLKTSIPYGVKKSKKYKSAKTTERIGMENARKQMEAKGVIMSVKPTLFMSIMHNTGIRWGKAPQVIKQLEMHEAGTPELTAANKTRIASITELVKMRRNMYTYR